MTDQVDAMLRAMTDPVATPPAGSTQRKYPSEITGVSAQEAR